jgi:hypothetical protein
MAEVRFQRAGFGFAGRIFGMLAGLTGGDSQQAAVVTATGK